jgi:outer membrane receptor for ferrienterochelin and colicin
VPLAHSDTRGKLQVITPDGPTYYTVNAGKATSEGLEVAATQRLGDPLLLTVNAAYTAPYATQAVSAAGISVGARRPTSPKWTVAAMLDYRMRDLDGWTTHLSGSWRPLLCAVRHTFDRRSAQCARTSSSWFDAGILLGGSHRSHDQGPLRALALCEESPVGSFKDCSPISGA